MADPTDPFAETRMTLAQHLDELRKRVLRGVIAVSIAFCVAWSFNTEIAVALHWPFHRAVAWLSEDAVQEHEAYLKEHPEVPRTEFFLSDDPADQRLKQPFKDKLQATGISETFMFAFRNTMYAAIAAGGPVLLWQMWGFIAAGLYQKERRIVMGYFPLSLLLFVAGLAMSFFLLVPTGIYYLQKTLPQDLVEFNPKLDEYMEFLSKTCIWTGVMFQMPLIIQVLIRMGIVEAATFAKYRRHFIVVAVLVAGFVTPSADPYSQMLLAGPMVILYELGILMGRWVTRKKPKVGAAT
ncbi:MAG: twin-arginine translocase subunit TatC [Planctomycetes bacterium]|nr:twin-arginine translocase subunit TatC [Planctomycetota bacterium]